MRELRVVALSEDGDHLVLGDAAGAEQFRVPVDDELRDVLRGRVRRPEPARHESALTPREIQSRLRAGQSAAEVAQVAGIPVDRVERYEGPVQAERARVVDEARGALLPATPGGSPGRPLGEVVDGRLLAVDDDPGTAQWEAWRRADGIWLVQLTSESQCARWTWDPVVRRVRPHDDAARVLVTPVPETAPPVAPPVPSPSMDAHPSSQGGARGPALTLVGPGAQVTVPAAPVPTPAPVAPARPAPAAAQVTETPRRTERKSRPEPPAAASPAPAPTPAAAGSTATAARTPAPRPAGRRGRKSVPAWDDIVFGARHP